MKVEKTRFPWVILNPEQINGKLDFDDIFGRTAPFHVEIGSGKGTFLLNQAADQPEINFLGIEWANKFYLHAAKRIGRHDLRNVRIMRTDAANLLAEAMPAESIDCLHIYFPDPWPKRPHHRRRLFQNANMPHILKCLKTGARIQLATDHKGYFKQMQQVIDDFSHALKPVEFIKAAGAKEGELVGTNFERKYIKEGKESFCLAALKN